MDVPYLEDMAFGLGAGLCGSCVFARRMTTDRESVFVRCERSFDDPRYAKYPHLPVWRCEGYVEMTEQADAL